MKYIEAKNKLESIKEAKNLIKKSKEQIANTIEACNIILKPINKIQEEYSEEDLFNAYDCILEATKRIHKTTEDLGLTSIFKEIKE